MSNLEMREPPLSSGETLNNSPYNRDYERNVYSLSPEPRSVANAVVGY